MAIDSSKDIAWNKQIEHMTKIIRKKEKKKNTINKLKSKQKNIIEFIKETKEYYSDGIDEELIDMNTESYKIVEELEKRINEAIDKIQYIIDYGFDYDGFNTVESLKGLIDMLVDYAIKSRNILNGSEE